MKLGAVWPICPDCDRSCMPVLDNKAVCRQCGQKVDMPEPPSKRWWPDGVLVTVDDDGR